MGKKRAISICSVILLCFTILFAYAQEDNQNAAIEKVVRDFLECVFFKNVDCIMEKVSPDYSDNTGAVEIDYDKFKASQARLIENASQQYLDIKFQDIGISNLNIAGDKAALELKFTQSQYDTDLHRTEKVTKRFLVDMEKAEGAWKITKWHRVSLYE